MAGIKDRISRRRKEVAEQNTPAPAPTPAPSVEVPKEENVLTTQQTAEAKSAMAEPAKPMATPVVTPTAAPSAEPTIETPKEANVLTPEQKEDIISSGARNFPFVKPAEAVKTEADRMNYEQMIQQMNRKAEEKQADIDKRNRRRAIFGAIGDGVAALSNLYFTTKGAPSVQYNPDTSLSARALQLDAQRKAEDEKAYLQAKNDRKDAITEERLRRQEERQDRIDRENKEYRDKSLAQQEQYRRDQLALQKYNAELNAQVRRDQFQEQTEREAAKQEEITRRTLAKGGSGGGNKQHTRVLMASGEEIDVPSALLNDDDIVAEMYYSLPEHLKMQAFEDYNLGKYNEKKQLTPTQMNVIVGRYRSHPDATGIEKVLRRIAGEQASTKKSAGSFSKTKQESTKKPLTGVE